MDCGEPSLTVLLGTSGFDFQPDNYIHMSLQIGVTVRQLRIQHLDHHFLLPHLLGLVLELLSELRDRCCCMSDVKRQSFRHNSEKERRQSKIGHLSM